MVLKFLESFGICSRKTLLKGFANSGIFDNFVKFSRLNTEKVEIYTYGNPVNLAREGLSSTEM